MATAEIDAVAAPAAQMAQAIDDYLEYLTGGATAGLSYEGHQAARRQKLANLRRARDAYRAESGV